MLLKLKKNDNMGLHFDLQIWKYLRDHKTCSDNILEQFQTSTIMIWIWGRDFFTPDFGKFDQTQPIYSKFEIKVKFQVLRAITSPLS